MKAHHTMKARHTMRAGDAMKASGSTGVSCALIATLSGALLGGCGSSPPTRFYSLEPTAPVASAPSAMQAPIKVDAVHIPSVLDRQQIVTGEQHYQLHIASQERWGGDFGEMVRRVLTQDLQKRLPGGMVVGPDNNAPADARGVVVDILSFAPQGSIVELDADWVLLQGSPPRTVVHHALHLSAPFEGSVASQAAVMSQLVGRLADDVAKAVQAPAPAAASGGA